MPNILETTELHELLQSKLEKWAVSKGYSEELPPSYNMWPKNDLKPDVLKLTPNQKGLFVGDAKNSDNETATNSSTQSRIRKYTVQFSLLLKGWKIDDGIIAIATDDKDSAEEWATTLDELATFYGLQGTKKVIPYSDGSTWIAYWQVHTALPWKPPLDIENQSGIQ